MKILALVSDAFGAIGGIARYNQDLIIALSNIDYISSIEILTRSQPGPIGKIPQNIKYNTKGIGSKIKFSLEGLRVTRSYDHLDIVLCGHINLLPIAFYIARYKKAELWCMIFGIDAWHPHPNPMVRWIIRKVDKVISISETTTSRFISWSNFDEEKITLIPNSYDKNIFFPGPKPNYLLERYRLHNNTVLMSLGRLVSYDRYKGFDEILEILPELKKTVPNIKYIIAGSGDDEERLREKVNQLNIINIVIFIGYVPENEKADHYRLADAFVMPSRGEGFGFVFLEAMACGIPVVGSKLDGSREALRNGKLGILVDPTNLKEVHDGILDALNQVHGKIPDGLDYFSFSVFQQRVAQLLEGV